MVTSKGWRCSVGVLLGEPHVAVSLDHLLVDAVPFCYHNYCKTENDSQHSLSDVVHTETFCSQSSHSLTQFWEGSEENLESGATEMDDSGIDCHTSIGPDFRSPAPCKRKQAQPHAPLTPAPGGDSRWPRQELDGWGGQSLAATLQAGVRPGLF